MTAPRLSLRQILHPRGVAVFGASEDRDKFGGRIIHFLIHHGFAGRIVPINPRRSEIRGHACYAHLTDAPAGVDVAILAVPTAHLLPALRECADAGVGACVIITTGFAEADAAGAELQQRMLDIALPAGMRIIGPNCMGLINPNAQLALCSSIVLDTDHLRKGRIGLVSQSGALMVSLFDRADDEGIGFSTCVSLGNQSDIEICDFIEYFADDPATDAVCVYVEGLRDSARFARAAAACRAAGKPVVLVKTGRTEDGVRAARSHTASLAGSYDAFAAVCRAQGVVLVDDPVTMVRVADLLLRLPPPRGDGIAVLSGSGGGAGIMVDRIAGAGMRLARLSPETRAALGKLLLPPQADNPVDLGGRHPNAPDAIDAPTLRALTDDPDVGVLLIYMTTMPFFEARTRAMAEMALAQGKPTLTYMLPGQAADRPRAVLRELACPCFESIDDLLNALRGVMDYHALAAEGSDAPARPADLPATMSLRDDTAAMLAAYGIKVPDAAICASEAEALSAAARMGFPVVMKGHVTGITHKTDLGLVRVNLADAAAVAMAWREIAASAANHGLGAAFTGVLLQKQIASGLELLVAIRRDPQFGPMVVLGVGGTLVELLRDVVQAPAPLSRPAAHRLLRRLRGAALLDGWRGTAPRDVDAVVDVLVRLGWLAVDLGDSLVDLEINPLIVGASGTGACAVDVRATWQHSRDRS